MREEERARLERMLERDKEEMNAASRRAALADFRRVAGEYFELEGDLDLTAREDGRSTAVTVSFRARRVKNFTTLQGGSR